VKIHHGGQGGGKGKWRGMDESCLVGTLLTSDFVGKFKEWHDSDKHREKGGTNEIRRHGGRRSQEGARRT